MFASGSAVTAEGNLAATEEYDGSSFANGGNVNTARRGGQSAGTQTAAVFFTGYTSTTTTNTEEYNGSAWTNVTAANVAREGGLGGGTLQTAAFIATGNPGTLTEHYDGTTWATAPSVTTARVKGGGAGTTDSGLGFGGYATKVNTEEFTSKVVSLNTAKTIDFD